MYNTIKWYFFYKIFEKNLRKNNKNKVKANWKLFNIDSIQTISSTLDFITFTVSVDVKLSTHTMGYLNIP